MKIQNFRFNLKFNQIMNVIEPREKNDCYPAVFAQP